MNICISIAPKRWRLRTNALLLFSKAAGHLEATGELPSLDLTQIAMAESRDYSDAGHLLDSLPRGYVRLEDDQVAVSIRAIRRAEPNHQLVDDFERAMLLLSRTYRRPREDMTKKARVSEGLLGENLRLSATRAEAVLTLLRIEGLVGHDPEGWFITRRIVPYLQTRDVDGYLRKKRRRGYRRRFRYLAESPSRLSKRVKDWLPKAGAEVVIGAIGGAVATLIVVFVLGTGSGHEGGNPSHRHPPSSKQKSFKAQR